MKHHLPLLVALALAGCSEADGPPIGPEPSLPATPSATPSGAPLDGPVSKPPAPDPACAGRAGPERPAVVSFDALRGFPGRSATKVAEVAAQPTPVRVCGPHGASQFLANLHCADGSRPIDSAAAAEAAHTGLAPGETGPCGTPIDTYSLTCGGSKRTVRLDHYWCQADRYFDRNPYFDY